MILIEDTRQHKNKHLNVHRYCQDNNIEIVPMCLNVGDYMLAERVNGKVVPIGNTSCDTKATILECANDLYTDKLAFNKKYKKCLKDGIKLIVLVEEKVNNLNELVAWKSKHSRINGRILLDMIHTIKVSYGVKFVFCDKKNTGETLLKLLKGSKL